MILPVGAVVRPPVPLVPAGRSQDVDVQGELHDESGAAPRTHGFRGGLAVARLAGTVPILLVRVDTEDGVIDLDVHGSLQEDGVLTVTIALRLSHPSPRVLDGEDGTGGIAAETTVVPAGGSAGFALTFLDEDGCRVRAHGSVDNGTGSPGTGPDIGRG